MAVATVELIVFAAQAGIKLVQTGRKVFVEATIGGEVEVPLPPAFQGMNGMATQAVNYAVSLKNGTTADEATRIAALKGASDAYENAKKDTPARTLAEANLVQLYVAEIAAGRVGELLPGRAGILSLLVLKQWEGGRSAFPSAFQRVAGTLAEIAVDYFVHVPGALNAESKQGKAVKSFLTALDDVNFSSDRADGIVISLFTAALDTLTDHPDIVSDEKDKQDLVKKIVGGVAEDVGELLKKPGFGDIDADARLKRVGRVVLRGLLENAGAAVIEDPSILGVEGVGGRALVQEVGGTFLALLLGGEDGDGSLGDGLRRIASTDGIDKLIRAALKVAVEHHDLFATGKQPVDKWLTAVLTDLYRRGGDTFFDPELFAEVAFSALTRGLQEFPALLTPGDAKSAVLVDVARLVFDQMGGNAKGATWRTLQLSRTDLKALFDGVFASLAAHTTWFSRKGKLAEALEAARTVVPLAVKVLAGLNDGSLKALVRSGNLPGVLAAVLGSGLLDGFKLDADVKAVVKGVNAVLTKVWERGVTGADRLLDENVLLDVLTAVVDGEVAEALFGENTTTVRAVADALVEIFDGIRAGGAPDVAVMREALEKAAA